MRDAKENMVGTILKETNPKLTMIMSFENIYGYINLTVLKIGAGRVLVLTAERTNFGCRKGGERGSLMR